MTLLRREFLHLMGGAALASALAFRPAVAQDSARRVRVATGLLATWQSAGVRAFDISNPFRPEEVGYFGSFFFVETARHQVVYNGFRAS